MIARTYYFRNIEQRRKRIETEETFGNQLVSLFVFIVSGEFIFLLPFVSQEESSMEKVIKSIEKTNGK